MRAAKAAFVKAVLDLGHASAKRRLVDNFSPPSRDFSILGKS